MGALLRRDESASSYNAGLGSENELQGGGASAPEPQAEASIGVQDCAGGAAAHGVDCDVPEELEAIIGELWRYLSRGCMDCSCAAHGCVDCRLQRSAGSN